MKFQLIFVNHNHQVLEHCFRILINIQEFITTAELRDNVCCISCEDSSSLPQTWWSLINFALWNCIMLQCSCLTVVLSAQWRAEEINLLFLSNFPAACNSEHIIWRTHWMAKTACYYMSGLNMIYLGCMYLR